MIAAAAAIDQSKLALAQDIFNSVVIGADDFGNATAALTLGSNMPLLDFDPTAEETAYKMILSRDKWVSGNTYVDIYWTRLVDVAGDVVWAVKPWSWEVGSTRAQWNEVQSTETTPGLNYLKKSTITIVQYPNFVAGRLVSVQISRKAADGADTYTGDARLAFVVVRQ